MHPTLLDLGPVAIHSYGLFVAIGFLVGIWWTTRETKELGLQSELVPDIALLVLVCAVVGARVLFVLLDIERFADNPLRMFMFWRGGLVFSGGLVLAVAVGWWFMHRKGQPALPWLDAAAPAIALGHGIGRFGCLAAGCCYGSPTHMPWGITFTAQDALAPLGVALHPTQIYHAIACFVVFGTIIAFKPLLIRPGQRVGLYLILFPAFRILVEFFRGDFRGTLGPFSMTQVFAMAFIAIGSFLLFRKPKGAYA